MNAETFIFLAASAVGLLGGFCAFRYAKRKGEVARGLIEQGWVLVGWDFIQGPILAPPADGAESTGVIGWGESTCADQVEVGEPIHVPDEWLDWPGKAQGAPRPRIVFYAEPCRADIDFELPQGCPLRKSEEKR